jgi:hypothetical protein
MADERQAALDAALKKIEKTLVRVLSCEWVIRLILKSQQFPVVH